MSYESYRNEPPLSPAAAGASAGPYAWSWPAAAPMWRCDYAGNAQAAARKPPPPAGRWGPRRCAVRADVADAAAVKALVEQRLEAFGRIHILVNNAGITRDKLALQMKEEEFDAVVDTNLKGAFLCMKAAYRPMMRQRYRPYRQPEQRGGPARQRRPGQLCRQQGRAHRHEQVPGQGAGLPERHCQRWWPPASSRRI